MILFFLVKVDFNVIISYYKKGNNQMRNTMKDVKVWGGISTILYHKFRCISRLIMVGLRHNNVSHLE